MRIAVIADVHSNLVALKSVLKDIRKEGEFPIIHCGDIVGYYPWPNEVVEEFKEKGIRSVMGNHDRAAATGDTHGFNPMAACALEWTLDELVPENLEYLKFLPQAMREDEYFMVHGSPLRPIDEYVYPNLDRHVLDEYLTIAGREILIMGHTHQPYTLSLGDRLILNPGSVGQPRDGDPRASYVLLDTKKRQAEIKRVEYEIERVVEKVKEAGLPPDLGKRLRYGF